MRGERGPEGPLMNRPSPNYPPPLCLRGVKSSPELIPTLILNLQCKSYLQDGHFLPFTNFFVATYRLMRYFRRRGSPSSASCIGLGLRAGQTLRRCLVGVYTNRTRNTPNGRRGPALSSPSPMPKCRDNIWSTWRRNFCRTRVQLGRFLGVTSGGLTVVQLTNPVGCVNASECQLS